MATHTLDFERPLLEWSAQIEELKRVAGERRRWTSQGAAPPRETAGELRTEIYGN